MVERQRKEEWEMLRNQAEAGRDEYKKLIEIVQASQVKQLQAKHDKYVNSISNFFLVILLVHLGFLYKIFILNIYRFVSNDIGEKGVILFRKISKKEC